MKNKYENVRKMVFETNRPTSAQLGPISIGVFSYTYRLGQTDFHCNIVREKERERDIERGGERQEESGDRKGRER